MKKDVAWLKSFKLLPNKILFLSRFSLNQLDLIMQVCVKKCHRNLSVLSTLSVVFEWFAGGGYGPADLIFSSLYEKVIDVVFDFSFSPYFLLKTSIISKRIIRKIIIYSSSLFSISLLFRGKTERLEEEKWWKIYIYIHSKWPKLKGNYHHSLWKSFVKMDFLIEPFSPS